MATQEGGVRLDMVVFGATGFTGKYAVEEVLRLAKEKGGITWGIAGRNELKLKNLLDEISKKTEEDLSKIPVIVADVKDEASLNKMASQAKIVINCAGPYRFYGEPVVKACVNSGTHHVDVSGEPQYMERMQLEYNKAAEEKGVYVISACGFDSIPADLGTVFFMDKFEGEVNSLETYLATSTTGSTSGAAIHYGTWESAIYGLACYNELRPLRQKLFPNRLPIFTPKLKPRSVIHKSSIVNSWCVPFPGSDRSVVLRSQRWFYENNKQRPIQMLAYVKFKSLLAVFLVTIMAGVFFLLSKIKFGRSLLLKNPRFFSGGMISHEGPSEETMKNTHFSIVFYGEGWTEKLAEGTDQHKEPPNKSMITKVKGTNPGYGATCTALVLSAITILKEAEKMPNKGGVFPPGAAFARTSLIKELCSHGFTFEVVQVDEK